VAAHVGEQVRVAGWLQAQREVGSELTFLVIRDGAGTVQAVAGRGEAQALSAADAMLESVIEVEGTVRAEPKAAGGVELHGLTLRVLSAVTEPLPVVLGKRELKAQLPVLLDNAVLTNRHPTRRAVFRIAAAAMAGFRRHLGEQGFVEIQSPKLVESATEGGANVFEVGYFGRPAYLAQSPQFYKQAMVGVFERVFEVGPVFRAEPHATARHLSQYTSLDVELGFIESHFEVMGVLTGVLRAMFSEIARTVPLELTVLGGSVPEMPTEIPHLHFERAQALVAENVSENERGQPDLSPEGERWLGEWARREHGSEFLFVTGYPMSKRPFYTCPEPGRPEHSSSFDLLFRGMELVTGGQRLHRYEAYVEAITKRGLSLEPFATYLQAFRCGMPPHGGFAIGLERFVMQLLGLNNIRLATLFPRDLGRLAP
jgi:nondiscriminating aspartyl-tRNA synthetase